MDKKVFFAIMALVLFTGGVVYMVSSFGGGEPVRQDRPKDQVATETETNFNNIYGGVVETGVEPNKNETDSAEVTPPGLYDIYDSSRVKGATGRIVLFFHSLDCTSCQSLEQELIAKRKNIPTGLTILDVDYESGVAFKEQYGVLSNHTLVEIDKEGNMIKKWIGSKSLDELVRDLN